jgi:hypothetical protein
MQPVSKMIIKEACPLFILMTAQAPVHNFLGNPGKPFFNTYHRLVNTILMAISTGRQISTVLPILTGF